MSADVRSTKAGRHPTGNDGRRPRLAARNRPTVWRSIRVRIMAPVLLATVGVGVLGTVVITDALETSRQADRASTLASAAGAVGVLVHEVALEFVQANEIHRAGRSPSVLAIQQLVTDEAVRAFATANQSISAAAPTLAPLGTAAQRSLGSLAFARRVARESQDGGAELHAYYDEILTALLALADALPAQMNDTRLIELSRSAALVADLDRLAALQLDLVTRGLTARRLPPGDILLLAEWTGRERTQVDTLSNLQPAAARYADLIGAAPAAEARDIRQVILDGRASTAALGADPLAWFRAQSHHLAGLAQLEQELTALLEETAIALGNSARTRHYLLGGLTTAVVGGTLTSAGIMAARTSRRLRQTRYAALTAARIELPTAISNVTAAHDAEAVRTALDDSSERIDSMLPASPDEIGEVASAFGTVHRQALRLAADQALLRMEVQAMFVALSRRGQTLVQRQIHLIDEFGRNEVDPDALSRLFALDHLAARMRRNEENLLVLAGGEPGRWITRPVAVVDLIRAAAQETEEYQRIEILEVPAAAVTAYVAGDTIHLLAELLENATNFSPPTHPVKVAARRDEDGLTITVTDTGIGLTQLSLAEVNERLARPSALTSTLVGTMGLLVVSRLAQRHGIQVRLDSVVADGTTATVVLPERLIASMTTDDRLQPGSWRHDMEHGERPAPLAVAATLPRRPSEPPAMDRDAQPMPPPELPDPESVRARLSSLAAGLASANARPHPPEPARELADVDREPIPETAAHRSD